jgi:phosphoenolpyruvate carboxylase
VDNAAREIARARLETAAKYVELAREGADPVSELIHPRVADEFESARKMILRITGQEELLHESPVIRKSISLRNPYTDVLNLLQIELLRRYREAPDEEGRERLRPALFLSINGIAAALQSTG